MTKEKISEERKVTYLRIMLSVAAALFLFLSLIPYGFLRERTNMPFAAKVLKFLMVQCFGLSLWWLPISTMAAIALTTKHNFVYLFGLTITNAALFYFVLFSMGVRF